MDAMNETSNVAGSSRAAKQLTSLLFLTKKQVDLAECTKAWLTSQDNNPSNPLNDPNRLTDAIVGPYRGSLVLYSRRSTPEDFEAVVRKVARAAAADDERSNAARLAMQQVARGGLRVAPVARGTVQRAQIDLLRMTDSEDFARQMLFAIVGSLELDATARDELMRRSLDTSSKRKMTAASLERWADGAGQTGGGDAMAIRATFADPHLGSHADLLGDIALTMFASAERAAQFSTGGNANPFTEPLGKLLKRGDRRQHMVENARITLSESKPVTDEGGEKKDTSALSESQMEQLVTKIVRSQNDAGARNAAIAKLAASPQRQATHSLARAAEKSDDTKTRLRLIRTLARRADPDVPRQLVKLMQMNMQRRHIPVAFRIAMALSEGTSDKNEGGKLSLQSSARDVYACKKYWETQIKSASWLPPGTVKNESPAEEATVEDAKWHPDETALKCTAAATRFTQATAMQLSTFRWQQNEQASKTASPGDPLQIQGGPDFMGELQGASESTFAQLLRLVQRHPTVRADNATYSPVVRSIQLRRKARQLACDSMLQECAVIVDACAELLELLIELTSPDFDENGMAGMRAEREANAENAVNVLHELRENAYANLLLWDLLTQPLN